MTTSSEAEWSPTPPARGFRSGLRSSVRYARGRTRPLSIACTGWITKRGMIFLSRSANSKDVAARSSSAGPGVPIHLLAGGGQIILGLTLAKTLQLNPRLLQQLVDCLELLDQRLHLAPQGNRLRDALGLGFQLSDLLLQSLHMDLRAAAPLLDLFPRGRHHGVVGAGVRLHPLQQQVGNGNRIGGQGGREWRV